MLTDVILGLVLVVLLALEAYALTGRAPLITSRVRHHSKKLQLIPFLAGLLCGHFWW